MLVKHMIRSILVEFPTGYMFSPHGRAGKTFIVARSTSGAVVNGVNFFCYSLRALLVLLIGSGLYSRVSDTVLPFLLVAGVALVWGLVYWLWALWVTRGLIENPNYGGVDDNA